MFDQFLGLPLHPLVVHAVVVLLPLGALALLTLVFWRKGRPVGLPLTTIVLAMATISAWVARFSGEALKDRVGVPDLHANLGSVLPIHATVTLIVAAVWWRVERGGKSSMVLKILSAICAVVAIVMTGVIGHSGAQSVWGEVTDASPAVTSTTPPAPSEDPSATEPTATDTPSDSGYTAAEVAEHATPEDCWAIINDTVYDLTPWVNQHPGGADRIAGLCGTDGTEAFMGQHSGNAGPQQQLTEFELGPLVTE